MVKKLILLGASVFLTWQSYSLLHRIDKMEISSWGLAIFIGWILNLFITGIFAFAGFAFPTQKLLPQSYYEINNPKGLKKIFKSLKVGWFRTALLATLWKSKKQRGKFFDGTKSGISNLEEQSKISEFGHLIPLILICTLTVYLLFIGSIKLALTTLLFNLVGNLYPVILQRHHRMRIQILRRRGNGK